MVGWSCWRACGLGARLRLLLVLDSHLLTCNTLARPLHVGHGGQKQQRTYICPTDHYEQGVIYDEELNRTLVQPLPKVGRRGLSPNGGTLLCLVWGARALVGWHD